MRAVAEHMEAWDRFPGDASAINVYPDVGQLATDWREVTLSGAAVSVLCGTLNFGSKIEPVIARIACSDGGVGVSVTSLWLIVRPRSQKLNLQELGQNFYKKM